MSDDPILTLSDEELREQYPTIEPHDLRRLRKAFLAKKQKERDDLSDEIAHFKRVNGL